MSANTTSWSGKEWADLRSKQTEECLKDVSTKIRKKVLVIISCPTEESTAANLSKTLKRELVNTFKLLR